MDSSANWTICHGDTKLSNSSSTTIWKQQLMASRISSEPEVSNQCLNNILQNNWNLFILMSNTSGRFKSYFWGVAGLASTFALVYCLVGLVDKYLSYPKNVVISLKTPDKLTFPSVTFCNMNPIKESSIHVRKKRQVGGGGCFHFLLTFFINQMFLFDK